MTKPKQPIKPPTEKELKEVGKRAKQTGKKTFAAWNATAKIKK